MWYVMQTITGKEQELVQAVDRVLQRKGYQRCFVIWQESVWRLEGSYKTCFRPLFPSYVFVETDTPREFYFALKQVPKLSILLGTEGAFWTVWKEEQELLCRLLDREAGENCLIRRSLVQVDEGGNICAAEGALKEFMGQIVKKRLRKRSVVVEVPFLGEKRRVQLGIRLEGDG